MMRPSHPNSSLPDGLVIGVTTFGAAREPNAQERQLRRMS